MGATPELAEHIADNYPVLILPRNSPWRRMLRSVGRTAPRLTLLAVLAACGTPWATGPSEKACGPHFAPGAPVDWSGRGNVAALGLDEADQTGEDADIYVTPPQGGLRFFCAVSEGGITTGPVPEGWRPP